jgi:hypothetical protein
MRRTIRDSYRIYVMRDGKMIEYSATDYHALPEAREAARRRGEYAEIRAVKVTTTVRLIERVEPVEAA